MRLRAVALVGVLLCLLTGLSYAAAGIPPTPSIPVPAECNATPSIAPTSFDYLGTVALSLLALTVSFDVVAIAFMISRLFPHLGIRNWLQGEYWEIGKSALIIVSIYAIIVLVGNLANAISPNPQPVGAAAPGVANLSSLVGGAEAYLCSVNANVVNIWGLLGQMASGTGFWSTLQLSFYVPSPTDLLTSIAIGINFGALFLPFGNWALQTGNFHIAFFGSIINDLSNFIMFPYTAMEIGVITLLPALAYIGLAFFIPVGLVFRALPFIRGIGGTLLAIGVALAVVLPAVLVLFNYPVTQALDSAIPLQQPSATVVPFSCPTIGGVFGSVVSTVLKVGCDLINAQVSTIGNAVSSIGSSTEVFSTSAIYYYMNLILQYGLYLIVQLVLLVIDIIIIYPIVDNIARVFGGSIKLSLGGKLRLAS